MYEPLEAWQLMAADVTNLNLSAPTDSGLVGDRVTSNLSPVITMTIAGATGGEGLELRAADGTLPPTTQL